VTSWPSECGRSVPRRKKRDGVEIGIPRRREERREGGREVKREKQAERKRGLEGWVSEGREDTKDQCNGETGRAEPENSRGTHRRDTGRDTRSRCTEHGFEKSGCFLSLRISPSLPIEGDIRLIKSSRYCAEGSLGGPEGNRPYAGHYKIDTCASSYITWHFTCALSYTMHSRGNY